MKLSPNAGKPIEILLVEDNSIDAEMTMNTLGEGRVRNRVHWVENGEEALAFLAREGQHGNAPMPDLILLDLDMPRMGGLEVLALVKQHADWKRIPVVIMTASTAEEKRLTAEDRHANCYVTKPLDVDQFIKVVRSIEAFWLAVVRLPAA